MRDVEGVLIPLLLDADVVAYFQEQAGENNYADLMNDVLKTAITHEANMA